MARKLASTPGAVRMRRLRAEKKQSADSSIKAIALVAELTVLKQRREERKAISTVMMTMLPKAKAQYPSEIGEWARPAGGAFEGVIADFRVQRKRGGDRVELAMVVSMDENKYFECRKSMLRDPIVRKAAISRTQATDRLADIQRAIKASKIRVADTKAAAVKENNLDGAKPGDMIEVMYRTGNWRAATFVGLTRTGSVKFIPRYGDKARSCSPQFARVRERVDILIDQLLK